VTDVDLGSLPEGVEVVPPPLDLGRWAPAEVLVVTADPELLAAAGDAGAHRLLPEGEATAAAVRQFVDLLDR
jgi:hypothetical protein